MRGARVDAADDERVPPVAAVFSTDPEVGRDLAQVDWAATPL
jgi:hypothetical protein